jgi:AcrR family transcriptional regulator
MAEATATKGYAATTVADILALAGVSRETFYEQFQSKLECFEHAFDAASEVLFAEVGVALPASGGRAQRFERVLGAYLDTLAAHPDLARLCLVEAYAAGPGLVARRVGIQDQFARRLEALLGVDDADARFACQALVAAVSSMVTAKLAAGDIEGLRRLRQPFAALVRRAVAQG